METLHWPGSCGGWTWGSVEDGKWNFERSVSGINPKWNLDVGHAPASVDPKSRLNGLSFIPLEWVGFNKAGWTSFFLFFLLPTSLWKTSWDILSKFSLSKKRPSNKNNSSKGYCFIDQCPASPVFKKYQAWQTDH